MKKEITAGLPVEFVRTDLPDAGILGYIYYHSWVSTLRDVVPERYLEPYTPEALADAMYRLMGTTCASYFLMKIDGEPSGLLAADGSIQTPTEAGEITHLFLLPEYIGKGYGKMALNCLLEDMKAQGKKEAALWVNAENARAVRFYESQGFAPTGEERTLYMGVEMKERRYQRTILT